MSNLTISAPSTGSKVIQAQDFYQTRKHSASANGGHDHPRRCVCVFTACE